MAQTGQPYAYTGDNPVNWIDPLGLSWYDPSWVHQAIHRFARGADKVGHFIATHKQAVITAAVILATLPLDETGIGEAIDADVIGADVTADGTADLVSDEMANEAAEEEGAQASEEVVDQAPSCGAQSFTPDTEVQLANGAKIPISQVRVGDMVLATDTVTGKTRAEPVTTLWINHDHDLMNVTVKTASGTSIIKSTQHHLFWDLSAHAWVQADDLSAGTALKTPNGATATVVATTVVPGAADMWDLTVNNDHDFYVVVSAGSQTAVLVHNCTVPGGMANLSDNVSMSTSDALDTASEFLGDSQTEVSNGVFQSAQDENGVFNQVRMTDNDLVEDARGPHLNFEQWQAGTRGATRLFNYHVWLPEEG